MTEVSGGATAPPRLRDERGRFVARNDTALLADFLKKGIVRFKDPFHPGVFTLHKSRSMKGYPVSLYHSLHGRGGGYGAWHVCRGYFDGYGTRSPYGRQLAISPKTHYGWPGDKWEGDRGNWTVEGMASLLIHLALSVDLREIDCGDFVGTRGPREDDD